MSEKTRTDETLARTGALLTGHFLLSSGRHSPRYVQCAKAMEQPDEAAALGADLAERLRDASAERVISPPLGALLIGYEVARSLGLPFAFPERDEDGVFRFRRGFEVRPGERVIVVEDVITTGRTTRELTVLLKSLGVRVVGLGAIVDRSAAHAVEGVQITALTRISFPTYEASQCPLCQAGEPLVKPGSRQMEGG